MNIVSKDFYSGDDVVSISRALLGKVLSTRIDGQTTQLIITETEAYAGVTDKASHAYGGRRTKRTEPMFGPGGRAYVYLCYGIHHLFNVVTNEAGTPHAVLIRAGSVLAGADIMLSRRGKKKVDKSLLNGPGCVGQAIGITSDLTGVDLTGPIIWIEDHNIEIAADAIHSGPRVGVDYAEEDAARPYRFVIDPKVPIPQEHGLTGIP